MPMNAARVIIERFFKIASWSANLESDMAHTVDKFAIGSAPTATASVSSADALTTRNRLAIKIIDLDTISVGCFLQAA